MNVIKVRKIEKVLLALEIVLILVGSVLVIIGAINHTENMIRASRVVAGVALAVPAAYLVDKFASSLLDHSWHDKVVIIQDALTATGFYDGDVDGEFGPMTEAALHRYVLASMPSRDDEGVCEDTLSDDSQDCDAIDANDLHISSSDDPVFEAATKAGMTIDDFNVGLDHAHAIIAEDFAGEHISQNANKVNILAEPPIKSML